MFGDFKDFVSTVHGKLPKAEILFISLSPSIARWDERDAEEAERADRGFREGTPRLKYISTPSIPARRQGPATAGALRRGQAPLQPGGLQAAPRARPSLHPAVTAVSILPAQVSDAWRIAVLQTESWRSAYRGLLPDEFLDGPVVDDRVRLWNARMPSPDPHRRVVLKAMSAWRARRLRVCPARRRARMGRTPRQPARQAGAEKGRASGTGCSRSRSTGSA